MFALEALFAHSSSPVVFSCVILKTIWLWWPVLHSTAGWNQTGKCCTKRKYFAFFKISHVNLSYLGKIVLRLWDALEFSSRAVSGHLSSDQQSGLWSQKYPQNHLFLAWKPVCLTTIAHYCASYFLHPVALKFLSCNSFLSLFLALTLLSSLISVYFINLSIYFINL